MYNRLTRTIASGIFLLAFAGDFFTTKANAQIAPSSSEIANYSGLHQAAHEGTLPAIQQHLTNGVNLETRDGAGRTALHVAAFASNEEAVIVLVKSGADLNALEHQRYDIITIAAVENDIEMLDTAISLGANASNITSPYDGTALIAAAHLGHEKVVARLIAAGAPLDHVNNLGWTALIEAVILGDGGPNHINIVRDLIKAGADKSIADRQGVTPIDHARMRGYGEIVALLEAAQ